MSDFFVMAVVDDLANAGFPLNAQQVAALIESRKNATAKAREEIRNAVRLAMVKEGFSATELRRAVKDLAQEALKNTIKERDLQKMVQAEVEKQVAAAFPGAGPVSGIVRGEIEKEAARLAQQFVQNNITVKADGGTYPHGGTF